jgi:hypothetical protein
VSRDVDRALESLNEALEVRRVALGRAVENVYIQFAPIVAQREKEYNDALRAASGGGAWSTVSGTGLLDTDG